MADRRAILPGIPLVPASESDELKRFLGPIKEILELRLGLRQGSDLEKMVTFRDLGQVVTASPALDPEAIFSALGAEVPEPPTDLQIDYTSLDHLLTWTWPATSRYLDAVHVFCAASNNRSLAQRVAVVSWPVAEWQRRGISPLQDHYYWLRIERALQYSTWEPQDSQGGYLLEKETFPTINDLISRLLEDPGPKNEYKIIADSFKFVLPSAAIADWTPGAYSKYAKVRHTLPGPGYTYYESQVDNNTDQPPSLNWQSFSSAVLDVPMTIMALGTIDGDPSLALRGDILADGTILGKHIAAEAMISLSDGGHLGIGVGATILVGGSGGGTTAPGLWYDGAGGFNLYGLVTFSAPADAREQLNVADGADRTSTVINGGLVTTGSLQLQSAGVVNAGFSAVGSDPTDVVLWSGATYANRAAAPYTVRRNGEVRSQSAATGERVISNPDGYYVYHANGVALIEMGKYL